MHVAAKVWSHGFIYAGNFAYMAVLALFPFFIVVSAVFSLVGAQQERADSVDAFMEALPPMVAQVLGPVGRDIIVARQGWLLWAGGLVALWTVSSLIETVRDLLRRAYGVPDSVDDWLRYRLFATAMTLAAATALLGALFLQVMISAVMELITARMPELSGILVTLRLSRLLPAAVLFAAIYLLFVTLTPSPYRAWRFSKWPGALLVTLWWGAVSIALPVLLRDLFRFGLTYGSLAGVMISLFFFWLVGLGMVTGAELNAALAQAPGPAGAKVPAPAESTNLGRDDDE